MYGFTQVRTGPHQEGIPRRCLIAAGVITTLLTPATFASGGEEDLPETMELIGVVRDFRERSHPGGHPDFERKPDAGFGLYSGNVAPFLSAERKPIFTGEGFRVKEQWTNEDGLPICWALFDEQRGDREGRRGASDHGGIESAQSFAQWFDDEPGVNQSKTLSLRLIRHDNGCYVFDDKEDPFYDELGGFFPIEDTMLGNPGGTPDRNFHFTLEIHTEFEYDAESEQLFNFIGDDDVWVFIDDKLVIDLGGVHGAKAQTVDLTRLSLSTLR